MNSVPVRTTAALVLCQFSLISQYLYGCSVGSLDIVIYLVSVDCRLDISYFFMISLVGTLKPYLLLSNLFKYFALTGGGDAKTLLL